MRRSVTLLLVALLALAGVGCGGGKDEKEKEKPKVVTVEVNEELGDGEPTVTTEVPAPVVEEAEKTLEDDLRDETPENAPKDALADAKEKVEEVKRTQEPLPVAGASAGFTGCRTRFVSNQSSRRGVRPIWQVLHYTVSPNRAGWSDVNAIIALFDRPSSQASSHFVIDAEGNCAYIVPIEAKAWTQAAGNPLSVAYEVINSGSEAAFMRTPGYRRLESVMRQVSARTGIPMRAGSVSAGRSGIVQHKDGSLAWGGHVDITPYSSSQVIKIITAGPEPTISRNDPRRYRLGVLTPAERRAATCLLYERRVAAKHDGWQNVGRSHRAKAIACKRVLTRRNAELHKAGLSTAAGKRARREARHGVIHAVV